MWINPSFVESLIREQLAGVGDRPADQEHFRSVTRAQRPRRRAWVELVRTLATRAASSVARGPRTTSAVPEAIAAHGVSRASDIRGRRRLWVDELFMAVSLVALLATGCGSPATEQFPSSSGRRIQGASIVAEGSVPVRVGAYELLFADTPSTPWQARRAALLVDLAAGQGPTRGFVEAGRAGEPPVIYTAGGWARQREIAGDRVTVFELQLNYLGGRDAPRMPVDAGHPRSFAIRVVVDEGSDEVTLTRRR